ncbi:uncharacterized protein LOC143859697 [Tasmannia lanceolata]|uniref:uncharacterized protein LOC143859697 n=1 Tax=Tasmannia lanceolata TaxID=3420 RepID=UPI0040628CD4
MRQRRWLELLKDYDLTISYHHGKANVEAHSSSYSVHPGDTKVYKDLKGSFWWNNMKREIAQYVTQCPTCQVIKAEHQRPPGTLQPLPISEWKWEEITMDFVSALPRIPSGNDSAWQAVDKIHLIREHLPTAQSRQKSYADVKRRELEFHIGDKVLLNVSPTKGLMRFGVRGKLSPRFVGPYEILEKIGKVAYRLALPPSLSGVHNVFHVSMLRKYISDPNHVIELEPLNLREDLSFEEQPIRTVDCKDQVLRRRTILYVKVQWRNHSEREATWELEEKMKLKYMFLFENSALEGEIREREEEYQGDRDFNVEAANQGFDPREVNGEQDD